MFVGIILGFLLGWLGSNWITDRNLYGSMEASPRTPKFIGVIPKTAKSALSAG